MLVKCLGTVMHGDDPLNVKAHPARRPIDLDDEHAYRLIQDGVAQPHGEAAAKRVEKMREDKARERIRLAQQWRGDDERDDEPIEDRAASDEQARALEETHNREARNTAGVQRIATGGSEADKASDKAQGKSPGKDEQKK